MGDSVSFFSEETQYLKSLLSRAEHPLSQQQLTSHQGRRSHGQNSVDLGATDGKEGEEVDGNVVPSVVRDAANGMGVTEGATFSSA